MKPLWTMLLLISTLLAVSCRQTGVPAATDEVRHPAIAIETLYQTADCVLDQIDPHARWFDSPNQLRQFWESQHQHHLGGTLPIMPEVDFTSEGVVLVHMGRQPTGGFALQLAKPYCRVVDEIVSIYVNWITPANGAAVIQMITAPCMLLKLSKDGYHSIQIVDQTGGVKASVDIPIKMD